MVAPLISVYSILQQAPVGFTELHSEFQLIVWPRTALLWFTLAAVIVFFSVENTVPPAQHQTAVTVSDQLVSTVKHLAATEPQIPRRSWWGPKTEQILALQSLGGQKQTVNDS